MPKASPKIIDVHSSTPVAHHPTWSGLSNLYSKEKILIYIKSRHIWNSFFDIYKYSYPQTIQECRRRLDTNVQLYHFQYTCIFVLSLFLNISSQGRVAILFLVIIIIGYFGLVFKWPSSKALYFPKPLDGVTVSYQAAITLWSLLSILLLISCTKLAVIPTSIGISIFLTILHALFHASEPDLSIVSQEELV